MVERGPPSSVRQPERTQTGRESRTERDWRCATDHSCKKTTAARRGGQQQSYHPCGPSQARRASLHAARRAGLEFAAGSHVTRSGRGWRRRLAARQRLCRDPGLRDSGKTQRRAGRGQDMALQAYCLAGSGGGRRNGQGLGGAGRGTRVLESHGAVLVSIRPAMLAQSRPGYGAGLQSLAPWPLEARVAGGLHQASAACQAAARRAARINARWRLPCRAPAVPALAGTRRAGVPPVPRRAPRA